MPFTDHHSWRGTVLVAVVFIIALGTTSDIFPAEAAPLGAAPAGAVPELEDAALAVPPQRGTPRPPRPIVRRVLSPNGTQVEEIPDAVINLQASSALSASGARAHAKLDAALDGLFRAFNAGGAGAAAAYARSQRLEWRGGRVLARIDTGWPTKKGRLEEASSRLLVDNLLIELDEADARVRRTWGPYIEAMVPMAAFEDLLGRDLPPEDRVHTKSFVEDDDIENDEEHGTAVSEIIYDIVPEVELYLSNIETSGDLDSAVTWMIDNDVHVINMSLGFFAAGPGNGTGPIVDIVERAPQRNIPFVTSAGNQADRHWIGPYEDDDDDGFNDFAPGDESNAFMASAGDEIDIFMSWDFNDYSSSSQDFDLLLLDSSGRIIAQSRSRQQGNVGDWASEDISILAPRNGTYHIVIQRISASLPEILQLHTFFSGLQFVEPEMSLTIPADGREVVAAGALYQGNGRPEFFSSRGPTKDGRIKPDFGAPDGVSTETYGPVGFFGTSAAAPHTAGAVALLVGRLGLTNPMQTIEMLIARARDVSPDGRDNITGWGRLSVLPQ